MLFEWKTRGSLKMAINHRIFLPNRIRIYFSTGLLENLVDLSIKTDLSDNWDQQVQSY